MPTVKKFESSDDESPAVHQKSKWEDEEEGNAQFRKLKKKKNLEENVDADKPEGDSTVAEGSAKSKKEKKKEHDYERKSETGEAQKQRDKDSRSDRRDRGDMEKRHDRPNQDRNFNDRRDNRDRNRDASRRDEFGPAYDRDRRGGYRNDRGGPRRDYGDRGDGRDNNRDRRERDRNNDGPAWATSRVKDHAAKLKQRKLLWGGKNSGNDDTEADEGASSSSAPQQVEKNMGMWSSAIAATGVDNKQAEKFKKLLGFKGAAAKTTEAVSSNVDEERARQRNLMSSLDKQFTMAREATHMGRGMGLGFHQ